MEPIERKIPVDPRSTVRGSSRPVPYDTGKVKIGLLYQPKQQWEPSADMELLQTALLRKQRPSYLNQCKERFLNFLKGLGL